MSFLVIPFVLSFHLIFISYLSMFHMARMSEIVTGVVKHHFSCSRFPSEAVILVSMEDKTLTTQPCVYVSLVGFPSEAVILMYMEPKTLTTPPCVSIFTMLLCSVGFPSEAVILLPWRTKP